MDLFGWPFFSLLQCLGDNPNKDVQKTVELMVFELKRNLDCSYRYEVTGMCVAMPKEEI